MSSTRHSDNLDIWSHTTNKYLATLILDDIKDLLVIDSRNEAEFYQGHIQNAINISHSKFNRKKFLEDTILIQELLNKDCKDLIEYEYAVFVYDENTEHTNQLDSDSFVIRLLEKLTHKFKWL